MDARQQQKNIPLEDKYLINLAAAARAHLDKLIKFCMQTKYPDIAHAASSLLGMDVKQLYWQDKNKIVYPLSVTEKTDTDEEQNKLVQDGMEFHHYLAFHVRFLLDYLIQFKKKIGLRPNKFQQQIIAAIKEEILIAYECFHIYVLHDRTLYGPEASRIEGDNWAAYWVTERAFSLTHEKQLVIQAQWLRHSVYITLIRSHTATENAVFVRIDNFGQGRTNKFPNDHPLAQLPVHRLALHDGKTLFFPRLIGKCDEKEKIKLVNYLLNVFYHWNKDEGIVLPFIYDFHKTLPFSSTTRYCTVAHPAQVWPNCYRYNYTYGEMLRLGKILPPELLVNMELCHKELIKTAKQPKAIDLQGYKRKYPKTFGCEIYLLNPISGILELLLSHSLFYNGKNVPIRADLYELLHQDMSLFSAEIVDHHKNTALVIPYNHLQNLTTIHLSLTRLSDQDAVNFAALIPFFIKLTAIKLAFNEIGNLGSVAIILGLFKAVNLNSQAVTELDLSHNQIEDEGALAIIDGLDKTKIKKLDLRFNLFGEKSIVAAKEFEEKHPEIRVVVDENVKSNKHKLFAPPATQPPAKKLKTTPTVEPQKEKTSWCVVM